MEICTTRCLCYIGQTGGQSVRPVAIATVQKTFQEASVTPLGPGGKPPQNTKPARGKTLHKA
jgi:hypothetical protein